MERTICHCWGKYFFCLGGSPQRGWREVQRLGRIVNWDGKDCKDLQPLLLKEPFNNPTQGRPFQKENYLVKLLIMRK